MSVRVSDLVDETVRAILSRRAWAGAMVLLAIVSGICGGAVTVHDSRQISDRAAVLEKTGWGLVVVSSSSGKLLASEACTVASAVGGVSQGGAIGETRESRVMGLEAGVSMTDVTAGSVDVAFPTWRSGGNFPSYHTPGFQALSTLRGGVIFVDQYGQRVPVAGGAISGEARFPGLDGGVLVVRDNIPAPRSCLLEVPPEKIEEISAEVAIETSSFDVVVAPVISAADAWPTPGDLAADHEARNYEILIVVFLLVLGFVRLLRTRRDRAVYRLLYFSRIDLFLMGSIDFLICLGVPTLIAFSTTVLWGEFLGVSTYVVAVSDITTLIVGLSVVSVGYSSLWAAGKNRHQFAPGG